MNRSMQVPVIAAIILISFLVSCVGPSPDSSRPLDSTAVAAASTLLAQTMTVFPTSTITPTHVPAMSLPTLTSTPLPFVALDGLRVVYIVDGSLYLQDSGKQVVQLANDVLNRRPLLSDDGQRIVFFRAGGSGMDTLCVVNADGTGERAIITLELLKIFGETYNEFTGIQSLAFIPGTRSLIFNTSFDYGTGESHPHSNKDLLLVNSDTGEIKQLRLPDQGGNFLGSPDGEKIAIQTIDHVDVIDAQGELLLGDLVARPPIDEYYGISWAGMFWTPDSNELIILPSRTDPAAAGIPSVRSVWRFPLDGNQGIEILLDPPPSDAAFSISPDRNWIAYTYTVSVDAMANWIPELVTWDSEKPVGIYLGNLRDGTSQLLYAPPVNETTGILSTQDFYHGWSPDSTHFIVEDYSMHLYIGDLQGKLDPFPWRFVIWIDDNRYLLDNGMAGELGTQDLVRVIEYPAAITSETLTILMR